MSIYDDAAIEDAGEPLGVDPLTDGEMTEIAPERLELLGASLAKRRDEWVAARAAGGVEKRWTEDTDQYNGRDSANRDGGTSMMDTVAAGGFPSTEAGQKPTRSRVFVNITRPKTNTAEARLANMLLPTDDRNWGIKPTPDPKLVKQANEEAKQQALAAVQAQSAPQQPQPAQAAPGQPPMTAAPGQALPQLTPGAQAVASATAVLEEAKQRASAMQDHIDDQLTECDYNGQLRMVLHDAAVLGTGVLKGPIVVNRVRKAWRKVPDSNPPVWALEIVEEKQPASERVSPWDIYPDPACGENVHNGIGLFQKKGLTSKQLRDLAKQPGYIAENISLVLEEGPQTKATENEHDAQRRREGGATRDESFEAWEYWGEFTPDDLRAAGVKIEDGATGLVSGCVIVVNRHVIKGFLNPLDTGDLPFDFVVWERADDSCWGYGVPHLLKSQQRVLNAAWRQLMDNAALSVGPQVVFDPTKVVPVDGRNEITGRKLWYLTDPMAEAEKAFATFDVENNGEELLKVIDMTMKFMDMESSTPELMQGEKGNAPETLGGMIMLQNTSNVVLTRQVKGFDDSLTRPHIRRYYDWNMCYADDDAIKGDFQVDARGTSALLVRDIQSQALIQLGQFSGNGLIAPMVNWENWFKEVLKAQRIDPDSVMKTDAEIAAAGAQPPQATPEQIRANAQLQVAQVRAGAVKEAADAKVQGELAYAEKMREIETQNAEARRQERQDELQLEMIKYANQNKLSLEQIRADLAKTAIQEQTKRQLAAASAQLEQSQHHATLAVDVHKHAVDTAAAAQPVQPAQGA
jgi:hypothetical protein